MNPTQAASPTEPLHLLAVNPRLDREALARAFARDGRVQIRDVLEPGSARELRAVLAEATPWGLAWRAGTDGPNALRAAEVAKLPAAERQRMGQAVARSAGRGDFAFTYGLYPMLDAYLGGWSSDGPHDIVMEHINDQPFLDLVRHVTGMPELIKADAQATLYAPTHFLAQHSDGHKEEGWRVAYVLSLAPDRWSPDWGGYLNFFDEDGDIVAGYRPRFNALSMFRVPQLHAVSYVPPFAPAGRFSVTGWFRDR